MQVNSFQKTHYRKHMLTIKPSLLSPLELTQSSEHLPLIRPFIIPFLKQSSPIRKWIAIEARLNNELIGLALSEVFHDFTIRATLYSLFVKPSYRRQGIGRQLFSFTQNFLTTEEKATSLEFIYTQEDPFSPAIEKILILQGWAPAKTGILRCHFDVYSFNPPWFQSPPPLPHSIHFFSWKKILPKDRRHIELLADQKRILPYLNPLREEASIHGETSVGLRQNKRVKGWCITTHPDPETICYLMLYIDKELLYKGYGIQLLIESIRRQKQLPIQYAFFEVNPIDIDHPWAYFIKKRLLPLAIKVEHFRRAFHFLTPP